MENILWNIINKKTELTNNKKLLFVATLAVVAFNCNAWNIENQKTSLGLTVKGSKLYHENAELTTKQDYEGKSINLKDSLDNCAKIIEKARKAFAKDFKNIIPVESFKESLKNSDDERQQNALKNGLVLFYCAYKYFKKEYSYLNCQKTQENIIKECCKMFDFEATPDLKHDINWYLTNKKWNAAYWIENVGKNGVGREDGVKLEKAYEVPYDEYLKDIESGAYKNINYTKGIIVSKDECEKEDARYKKAKEEFENTNKKKYKHEEYSESLVDYKALEKAMKQFIVRINVADFARLQTFKERNEAKTPKSSVKQKKVDVYLKCDERYRQALIQETKLRCPGRVKTIDFAESPFKNKIGYITFPATVRFVRNMCFSDFTELMQIVFANTKIVFEDIVFENCNKDLAISVNAASEKELYDFAERLYRAGLPRYIRIDGYIEDDNEEINEEITIQYTEKTDKEK